MAGNLLDELDALIKRASAEKEDALKGDEPKGMEKEAEGGISGKLDNADDGTSPATTGSQAADQISAQNKMYPDNTVDTGAKDSKPGESVAASTDGATAASPDGNSGAQGAVLEPKKEADNGEEKPENKVASYKTAAESLRKIAKELSDAAEGLLSPLDRFLVKSARASEDKAIVKIAQEMDDAGLADAAAASLMEQIENGQIGEEEAAAILEEAVNAGAVSEDELQEAVAAMGGAEAAPEAVAGDMGMPMDQMDGAPEIANLEEKLAAAEIGPDHPEYIKKLASLYPEDIQAGYAFGMKLAEDLMAAEEEAGEEKGEEAEEKGEEAEEEGEEAEEKGEEAEEAGEAAAVPPVAAAPAAPEAAMGAMPAPTTPEEQEALAAVQQELGLDDAALAQLMAQEVPAPMGKVAEAKIKYRDLIYKKVAALRQ